MSSSSVDNDVDIIPECDGVVAYSEDNPLGMYEDIIITVSR